jgi:CBS domain-containing membrane protein
MNLKFWTQWLGVELNEVSPKEKLISGLGGFVSILFTVFLCGRVFHADMALGLIASMGASAVLLFAVPHGQLSQPWPVIAGHGFSALIGVACGKWIQSPPLAGACAVGLAIVAMHQLKCIHPPGGATALTAVLGSPEVHRLGFHFVLFPVLLNAVAMVAVAVLFNACFRWRRYPAYANHAELVAAHSVAPASDPSHEEITTAIRSLDSFVDITEDDLLRLLHLLNERKRVPAVGKTGTAQACDTPAR